MSAQLHQLHPDWQAVRRILCIRLDSPGDVLMCTPAIRALRASMPGCHLTLLSSPSGAAAAPFIPELDAAIAYAAPWMKQEETAAPESLQECAAQLAGQRFDAAVIFTAYWQSPLPAAMLCHLAGIPLRLASCREDPYQLLTHWVPEPVPEPEPERERASRHEVQRQLDLVARVGCQAADTAFSFAIPPPDAARVDTMLLEAGIDPAAPYLVLHADAGAAAHRYPVRHWLVLIGMLGTRLGYPIILTGERRDLRALHPLPETWIGPAHSFIGKLGLGELGALIRSSSLLITGSAAPAHIAAAVGTPLVDLYALTQTHTTSSQVAQRLPVHDISCGDCLHSGCPDSSCAQGRPACLDALAPRAVLEAAVALLAGAPPRPARTDDAALAFA